MRSSGNDVSTSTVSDHSKEKEAYVNGIQIQLYTKLFNKKIDTRIRHVLFITALVRRYREFVILRDLVSTSAYLIIHLHDHCGVGRTWGFGSLGFVVFGMLRGG